MAEEIYADKASLATARAEAKELRDTLSSEFYAIQTKKDNLERLIKKTSCDRKDRPKNQSKHQCWDMKEAMRLDYTNLNAEYQTKGALLRAARREYDKLSEEYLEWQDVEQAAQQEKTDTHATMGEKLAEQGLTFDSIAQREKLKAQGEAQARMLKAQAAAITETNESKTKKYLFIAAGIAVILLIAIILFFKIRKKVN